MFSVRKSTTPYFGRYLSNFGLLATVDSLVTTLAGVYTFLKGAISKGKLCKTDSTFPKMRNLREESCFAG